MNASEYTSFRERFVQRLWSEIAPFAAEIEEREQIPYDEVMPVLADMGALGLLVPPQHGGSGLTIRQYVPLLAEIAKAHGGIRALIHVHNSFAHALDGHMGPEQMTTLLPAVARGDASIAFALTEPDRGTGLDIGTVAAADAGELVIDGRKWLVSNSAIASHFIVVARTPFAGPTSVSAILVPRSAVGIIISPLPETMGCKGGEHGILEMRSVRCPADAVIGAIGHGPAFVEQALEVSRVLVAASSLGVAEHALALSAEHARRRVTFGKPIGERQAVQRYLAEMAMDVHALRLMVRDAAEKCDRGERIPLESSATKLFGLEAVGRVTDRALLVFGGIGYTRRHPIERLYRDARLNWLEEGTPTIQHLVAARSLADGHRWDDIWS